MRTIILSSLLPGRSVYLSASERKPNKSSHQSAAFCVGRNMGGLSLIEAFPRIQSVKPSRIGVDLNPHIFEDCICVSVWKICILSIFSELAKTQKLEKCLTSFLVSLKGGQVKT